MAGELFTAPAAMAGYSAMHEIAALLPKDS
jgi:hypothetical protein